MENKKPGRRLWALFLAFFCDEMGVGAWGAAVADGGEKLGSGAMTEIVDRTIIIGVLFIHIMRTRKRCWARCGAS